MNKTLDNSKRFLKKNVSIILTCVGGVGVVVTAVMAAKATPKAMQLVEQAEKEKGIELTRLETFKVAGPVYIPSIVAGVSTLACVFGASMLSKHSQASLMSAYALLDSSYKDYKNKVTKLYGEESASHIREEIAKDKYTDDISTSGEKELFYDYFSGRYFESTKFAVQQAEYRINRHILARDYASINDFYDLLGIDRIDGGYEVGWTSKIWLDFAHEQAVMDDGLECTIIIIQTEPVLIY